MEEASKPASEGSPAAKRSRAETELPEPPGFHPDGPGEDPGKGRFHPGRNAHAYVRESAPVHRPGGPNYQDTVDRAEAYWGSIEKAGGRLLHQVWTMGDYDIVMLFEAPDDETAEAAVTARRDPRSRNSRDREARPPTTFHLRACPAAAIAPAIWR